MTTTGERLVQLSGLSSGGALAHFQSIQTGVGPTFASRFFASATESQTIVTRKARKIALQEPVEKIKVAEKASLGKDSYVFAPPSRAFAYTEEATIYVLSRTTSSVVMTRINELAKPPRG